MSGEDAALDALLVSPAMPPTEVTTAPSLVHLPLPSLPVPVHYPLRILHRKQYEPSLPPMLNPDEPSARTAGEQALLPCHSLASPLKQSCSPPLLPHLHSFSVVTVLIAALSLY